MALRKILTFPDDALTKHSREVTNFDKRLQALLDDMLETMRNVQGAGLAAVQVGVLRRVCVVECVEGEVIELINPVIAAFEGEQDGLEGCLSVPGMQGTVKRPMKVTVKAFDRKGKPFEVTGEELMARALCHELDHLDGKLYLSIAENVEKVTAE